VSLAGCATIPSEAPELSATLGQRISAIEDAHINLLHAYFNDKRRVVDEFIQEKWVPTFAKEVFSDPRMVSIWNEKTKPGDDAARYQLFTTLGPKLQERTNKQRVEMIQPLDNLERAIEARLRSEYDQAKAINNTITSFLASASKVEENRKRYMSMIGLTDEKINAAINATDSTVSTLLGTAKDVEATEALTEGYVKKIRGIYSAFTGSATQ
jgi:hypothetical protein